MGMENRALISRGREYYKVFSDAAQIRAKIDYMAKQKKPFHETQIKGVFTKLVKRLESFAKHNAGNVYGKAAEMTVTEFNKTSGLNLREVYFSLKTARDEHSKFFENVVKTELKGR